jgi:hypothetical protein
MLSKEASSVTPIPWVDMDSELSQNNVPYTINVDLEGCASALLAIGIPEKAIAHQRIHVIKDFPLNPIIHSIFRRKVAGLYHQDTKTIDIFTEPVWQYYQKRIKAINKLIKGKGAIGQSFKSRRFINYLQGGDSPERRRSFGEKLVLKSINRDYLSSIFIHEAGHHLKDLETGNVDESVKDEFLRILGEVVSPIRIGGIGLMLGTLVAEIARDRILLQDTNTIDWATAVIWAAGATSGFLAGVATGYMFSPHENFARSVDTKEIRYKYPTLITLAPKNQTHNI